ncbi:MAG: NAD-dependent epimerase/dehydratase family protein [Candidatus Woesearchaeota archaeon]
MKQLNILVTGGAGFIGSHVVDKYIELGHRVVVVDNLSTGKIENINPNAEFYKMDITDKKISKLFEKHKFDVLNHHAAQIDVRKSVEDPAYDATINIIGLLNLLENCVKNKVRKVVYISSGGVVYGQPKKMPPNEDYSYDPESPYGVSKVAGEIYLRYYNKVHGLNFTALRYSNVYGPRQNPEGEAGVVAIFSLNMLKGKECKIFGDGEQTRDYVFVGDVAEANALCIDRGDNQSFNIGTGIQTSVNELFKMLSEETGNSIAPKYMPPRKGELLQNYLDCRKAAKILQWRPKNDLKSGLKKTVEWIKKSVESKQIN